MDFFRLLNASNSVTSLKDLAAVVSDNGSTPETVSMIAQAVVALTKLKPIWRGNYYISRIKGEADALPYHFLDLDCRFEEKNTGL